jgi:hypothetical protein
MMWFPKFVVVLMAVVFFTNVGAAAWGYLAYGDILKGLPIGLALMAGGLGAMIVALVIATFGMD